MKDLFRFNRVIVFGIACWVIAVVESTYILNDQGEYNGRPIVFMFMGLGFAMVGEYLQKLEDRISGRTGTDALSTPQTVLRKVGAMGIGIALGYLVWQFIRP